MNGGISVRAAWIASCVWVLIMAAIGYLGAWSWGRPISGEAMLLTVICVIGVLIIIGVTDWD